MSSPKKLEEGVKNYFSYYVNYLVRKALQIVKITNDKLVNYFLSEMGYLR